VATRPIERPTALRYVETSALLAALIEKDVAAASSLKADGPLVASTLTFAEAFRGIVRARTAGQIDAAKERELVDALQVIEQHCDVIAMAPDILVRVRRSFPVEPLRTLDAIHLSTIESLEELPPFVTVLTRDDRIRKNAAALGYAIE
jgi:predicted nucleic acid-binding protein